MSDEKTEILVRLNGPYRITGPVKVVDADGKEFELPAEVFALCRCGHSGNKPFCDGTHKKSSSTRRPAPLRHRNGSAS
jgi:CDGSH-type Zn-finger protein